MSTAETTAPDSNPTSHQYTAEKIAAMFKRPTNARELLQNLKIVVDRDLLLQPAFGENALLMKIFAGSAVKDEAPSKYDQTAARRVSVTIDDAHFPEMTVSLHFGLANDGAQTGITPQRARRFGWIEMSVASVPGFDVREVRDVFGQNAVTAIDHGNATDGAHYVPTIKGKVDYPYYGDKTATSGPPYSQKYQWKDVLFKIKLDSSPPEPLAPGQRRQIFDRDEVQDIRIAVEDR
jgi:hypothetical protein